jgi:hypothetical protein
MKRHEAITYRELLALHLANLTDAQLDEPVIVEWNEKLAYLSATSIGCHEGVKGHVLSVWTKED